MDARPAEAGVIFCAPLPIENLTTPLGGMLGMELKLYDTLTRDKRVFTPIDPQRVRMYVCGPTVYDFAHIGNARPVLVFDVLFRLLRHVYGADHVIYVRNITDVDDKINARAAQEHPGLPLNEAIRKVTETTDRQFHEDVDALGALRPTIEPRATEHITEMAMLIERLVKSGNAYVEADHVLFSVPSMPDYGRLAKRSLDEMVAGARVDVAPYKHDPMDFVLWKPSKPGEPAWPSPAGIAAPGRPGWHLECSAMSWKHLGETFDIHGGGIDLVFPHHENEIAQSRCAFHAKAMANYWMHNGFLEVEGRKMSKSEGNFITIHQLLADWPGEVLRLNMLRTHYRQPIDWTTRGLEESEKILDHWYELVGDMTLAPDAAPDTAVMQALCDDLNTPSVLTRLHAVAAEVRTASGPQQTALKQALKVSGELIGLLTQTRDAYAASHPRRKAIGRSLDPGRVDALIAARAAARKAKNFAESDRIRDELAAMGVVLKDSKDGTTWEIAR
jgi:cysteinyl-tRNA synthetase